MLVALSTGGKIGLGVVALVFIAFALASALLIPRYRPDFPGRRGLRLFLLATLGLFLAMMAAVNTFGKEDEEEAGGHGTEATETTPAEAPGGASEGGGARKTVEVAGTEFKFELPDERVSPGDYTFALENTGQVEHNLVFDGPGLKEKGTPVIDPGRTASVDVSLAAGTYKLYCSVPGHADAGMMLELEVS